MFSELVDLMAQEPHDCLHALTARLESEVIAPARDAHHRKQQWSQEPSTWDTDAPAEPGSLRCLPENALSKH